MATAAEIRNRALRKLGVLESGGTPTTDEQTDADAAYAALYAFLSEKHAVTWDSDESIPVKAENAVVKMLMAELADEFGSTEGQYQRLQAEASIALDKLIWLAAGQYVPTQTEGTYF